MKRSAGRLLVFSLVALIAGLGLPLTAQAMHAWDDLGTNDTFSIRASVGLLEGEAREIVYDTGSWGIGTYKASELIWDLSGLSVAGAVVSVKPASRVSFHAGFWTCVNEGNGGMVDYDWAISGMDWTDRSISDVAILSSYMLDANVAVRLLDLDTFTFSAVIGYKQDYWEWDDSFVELLYSVDGFRDYYEAGDGSNMIDYNQVFRIPYIGLNAVCRAAGFHLNAYALYSPFVAAEDNDYHIERDIHFKETFSGGTYLGAGLAAQLDLTRALFLAAALDVQSIPTFTGNMQLTDELGDTYKFSDAAGISHLSSMASLSLGVRF
jgi:outer membrane protease